MLGVHESKMPKSMRLDENSDSAKRVANIASRAAPHGRIVAGRDYEVTSKD